MNIDKFNREMQNIQRMADMSMRGLANEVIEKSTTMCKTYTVNDGSFSMTFRSTANTYEVVGRDEVDMTTEEKCKVAVAILKGNIVEVEA